MQESTLLKISLAGSLLGIFILLIISEKIEVTKSDIKSISDQLIDKQVKIKGKVTSIKETPGLFTLTIADYSGSIKVIVFKEENLELKKGDIIEVLGIVKRFKDDLEIEADLIKLF